MTVEPATRRIPSISTVARPRLMARLDEALAHRLTSVIGGPGTGKTTLLVQWAATTPTAWHTANPGESVTGLMQSIVDALQPEISGPGPELAMAVDGSGLPTTDTDDVRADALAAALCHHVGAELGDTDLTLVVDDIHLLDPDGEPAALLAGLVRHAPDGLHLVFASRRELPFPTNRLVIDGLAVEIDTSELAFTVDEAGSLLGDDHNVDAAALVAHTGGWAIATAFAARGERRPGAPSLRGRAPLGDERRLFAYLADEVLGEEEDATVEALRVAAALPWVTVELSDYLGLGEAGRRLADRRRSSIAMVPVPDDEGAVTVAPLVREFLSQPARPTTSRTDHVPTLLGRAAGWYEQCGAHSSALRCLVWCDDRDGIADLLLARGRTMIAGGQASDVLEASTFVPPERRDLDFEVLEADALQATGEWELARDRFERIVPEHGSIPAAVAWRLGFIHYMRGEPNDASAVLDRGDLAGDQPAEEAALLAWMAATRWARGERDTAAELAGDALRRAAAVDDAKSLAAAYTVLAMVAAIDGDRAANYTYYLRALEQAERARDLMQIVRIHCNCGSHHLEVGEYDKAMAELEPAIMMADLGGFGMLRGLCLTNRAEVLIAWGRFDEAVADLDSARSIFQRIASAMDTYPLTLLGQVHASRGEMAQARGAFEQAAHLAESRADLQALVPALAGLAMVRLDEDPQGALELARRATDSDHAVAHPRALLALGWVTLANGDKESSAELSERVAALARTRLDRPSLAEALELAAAIEADPRRRVRLLGEAQSLWSELGSPLGVARVDLAIAEITPGSEAIALAEAAASTFDRLGAKRSAGRARSLSEAMRSGHDAGLSVQILGGFSVLRDGAPVPSSAWQSKVARDLCKMLVVNRGRPLPRDVLIDRLWPAEVGEKANNRLSVALSTIRNVFDPARAHPPDYIIVADRDSVAIDLHHVSADVERFLADVARGRALISRGQREQGLALLRLAEAMYVGDVLEEQPYADWAVALREEALTTYLSIAAILARHDAAAADHDSAARRYLRMLERDPYNEHAHLGAIRALRAAGHHGPAQRLYRNYVAKMAEIDVEPTTFPAV